jgi:uncharacterized membrane protein (Fun14 family)
MASETTNKGDKDMNTGMRWRIIVLQVGLIGIIGFVAGFAFWGSSFATSQVSTQLAAQKISFPAANNVALTSLPAADAAAMRVYAGQELTTGAQAETYADHFIAVHLNEIAGGQTYSQLSAASQADPTNTKLAGEVATIFKGTSLRGMLLNAYGWGEIGTIAGYAAIGLAIAALAVLGAFLFEIFSWRRHVSQERTTHLTVPSLRSAHVA